MVEKKPLFTFHIGRDGRQAPVLLMRVPSLQVLSTMLSVVPEPAVAIMPCGMVSSILSLRLKGAALPWLFQSGLKTTWMTPRVFAHRAGR
jgi:hypothetical protein